MHWTRWQQHGDPTKVLVRGIDFQIKPTCSVDGCEEPNKAHSFCSSHLARWERHGDPLGSRPPGGFTAVHHSLRRQRGRARDHRCVDCGGVADEWSYNHRDPNEETGVSNGAPVTFSRDLSNYDPRCLSCHRRFDKGLARPTISELLP